MTQKQATKAMKSGEIDMNDMKLGKEKPSVKKQSKFQQDVANHVDEVKVIWGNTVQLTETVSLLIIAGYGFYGSLTQTMRVEYKYAILFSSTVVGLIAMNLLRKHLARR